MMSISFTIVLSCFLTTVRVVKSQWVLPKGDDGCDKYLWRRCNDQNECDNQTKFIDLYWANKKYIGWHSYPPSWQDYHYNNYAKYTCRIPPIQGCNVKRCVPELSSGFNCEKGTDCFEGGICNDKGYCAKCGETPGYAHGACYQNKTVSKNGTPAYEEGESGCAGDHCGHTCAYDTKCVRILQNITLIALTATHNGLGVVEVTDESRDLVMRPSTCGGDDAGLVGSGMRCAGPVHRAVTQFERTPDKLRGREDNIVELRVEWRDDYFEIDEVELESSIMRPMGNINIFVGMVLPDIDTLKEDQGDEGIIVGKGIWAYGLADWHHGLEGIITCDVRYNETASTHATWAGIEPDLTITNPTLQTRACIRFKNQGETVISFKGMNFGNDDKLCGEWSASFDYINFIPSGIACTLTGPDVRNVIPNKQQRDHMVSKFLDAYHNEKTITGPPLLRIAFHDAAVHAPPDLGLLKGGPKGCMRFEHVQGNEGNSGLHFTIDNIGPAVGCGMIRGEKGFEFCPWSVADILQFHGALASAVMIPESEYSNDENNFDETIINSLRWGRTDSPMIHCQGELQLNQPDHDGGHLAGFFKSGSNINGDVSTRLFGAFDSMRDYFENRLHMEPKHWTAILGAHSVGGVRGLIQARNTRFMFDETPDILDNLYYQRLALAATSNLLSLCPMNKKMGHAHWWGPGKTEWASDNDHWLTLLDIDVSMVFNSTTLEFIHMYATNQSMWLQAFKEGFLIVSELGYAQDVLSLIPSVSETKTANPSSLNTAPPSPSSNTTPPSISEITAPPSSLNTAPPFIAEITANPSSEITAPPSIADITAPPSITPRILSPSISPTMLTTFAPTMACKKNEKLFSLEFQAAKLSKFHNQIFIQMKKRRGWKKIRKMRRFPNNKLYVYEGCFNKKKCFRFKITDKKNDGLCCDKNGDYGWYNIYWDGEKIDHDPFISGRKQIVMFGNKCPHMRRTTRRVIDIVENVLSSLKRPSMHWYNN